MEAGRPAGRSGGAWDSVGDVRKKTQEQDDIWGPSVVCNMEFNLARLFELAAI